MKLFNLISVCCMVTLLNACNKETAVQKVTINASAEPAKSVQVNIRDIDTDKFLLELQIDNRLVKINRDKEAKITPKVAETFQTSYCGKTVLIIILQSELRSGVFEGFLYSNLVFNTENDTVIDELIGGEIKEKQTNAVESDDQKEILQKLKAGVKDPKVCEKMK
jgi:hypothetical protein